MNKQLPMALVSWLLFLANSHLGTTQGAQPRLIWETNTSRLTLRVVAETADEAELKVRREQDAAANRAAAVQTKETNSLLNSLRLLMVPGPIEGIERYRFEVSTPATNTAVVWQFEDIRRAETTLFERGLPRTGPPEPEKTARFRFLSAAYDEEAKVALMVFEVLDFVFAELVSDGAKGNRPGPSQQLGVRQPAGSRIVSASVSGRPSEQNLVVNLKWSSGASEAYAWRRNGWHETKGVAR
jgi:hypothetical protein